MTHASGPDTVTPSGPTRLGDAFVNIPSFEEMLVNGNVRLGKEGNSEVYSGWLKKGKASNSMMLVTDTLLTYGVATSPHSNPRLTG